MISLAVAGIVVALSGCAGAEPHGEVVLVAPVASPAPTVTKTVTAKPHGKPLTAETKSPTSPRASISRRQGGGHVAWPGTRITVKLRQQFRDDVVDVQQAVVNLGYAVAVDGHYGAATATAVAQMQRDHGLAADGVVGPATWDLVQWALGNLEEEQAQGAPDVILPDLGAEGSGDPLPNGDDDGGDLGGATDLGPGAGSTVVCGDGSISHSGGIQGACSHHGGVS